MEPKGGVSSNQPAHLDELIQFDEEDLVPLDHSDFRSADVPDRDARFRSYTLVHLTQPSQTPLHRANVAEGQEEEEEGHSDNRSTDILTRGNAVGSPATITKEQKQEQEKEQKQEQEEETRRDSSAEEEDRRPRLNHVPPESSLTQAEQGGGGEGEEGDALGDSFSNGMVGKQVDDDGGIDAMRDSTRGDDSPKVTKVSDEWDLEEENPTSVEFDRDGKGDGGGDVGGEGRGDGGGDGRGDGGESKLGGETRREVGGEVGGKAGGGVGVEVGGEVEGETAGETVGETAGETAGEEGGKKGGDEGGDAEQLCSSSSADGGSINGCDVEKGGGAIAVSAMTANVDGSTKRTFAENSPLQPKEKEYRSTCKQWYCVLLRWLLFIVLIPVTVVYGSVTIIVWLVCCMLRCCCPVCSPCLLCLSEAACFLAKLPFKLIRGTCCIGEEDHEEPTPEKTDN